jgi:hypothetical protein
LRSLPANGGPPAAPAGLSGTLSTPFPRRAWYFGEKVLQVRIHLDVRLPSLNLVQLVSSSSSSCPPPHPPRGATARTTVPTPVWQHSPAGVNHEDSMWRDPHCLVHLGVINAWTESTAQHLRTSRYLRLRLRLCLHHCRVYYLLLAWRQRASSKEANNFLEGCGLERALIVVASEPAGAFL